jgi:NtrC-family two-component system response regulator AlgB
MAKLLIVDDERNIRRNLVSFFESCGHQVEAAEDGERALELLREKGSFDLVLSDYRMAEMNGLELLRSMKAESPDTLVILMTAYGTIENAVAAMKAGAHEYVTKPFSLEQIQHVVERALEMLKLRSENQILRKSLDGGFLFESSNARMRTLIETARQAATSEATILLAGESGTGKTALARQIHDWSSRRDRQFVVVNCTTLAENLLESELFGHVRGAFTGAIKDKPGRLEAADGGTVFLDEVADLPIPLQAKLLRFLQEQEFERVGGNKTIRVDVRMIAASNRDLDKEVTGGRFREDLYYRLNVIALKVPPLRERPEDITPLATELLGAAAVRYRRGALSFSPAATEALTHYGWPGNVRELRNAVERAVVLSRAAVIHKEDLPDAIFRNAPAAAAQPGGASIDELEREHIRRVLAESATLEEAADALGIGVVTLWRKRRKYGIE